MPVSMSTEYSSDREAYTVFFARASNWDIVLVKNDADFFHEANLRLIVALQVIVISARSVRVCEMDIDTRK